MVYVNDADYKAMQKEYYKVDGGRLTTDAMLDIMFEVPSMTDIDTCIITDDVIRNSAAPIFKMLKKQTA